MGKKILIVDDEVNVVKSLTDLLQAKGYEAASALDGAAGIRAMKKEKPDLVLLDIMMPKVSGLEFLKRIKKKTGSVQIPIIMLTARSDKESLNASMRGYAEKFIVKPYDPQELLESIESSLQNIP
jgi:DNA-binding response OmpR family regulator